MIKKEIFEYRDYRSYLMALIASKPKGGRGLRAALAKSLGSPVSHVSQVLNGISDFSLEQAESVNEHFGHTAEEATFFLLLVQFSRAGTRPLKIRTEAQMQQILAKRLDLKDRLGVKASLGIEDQMAFYSSWLYGAVHVMLSIKQFQTNDAIASHLGVSLKRVSEILEFLVSVGLAKTEAPGRYEIGTSRIHLGSDSPMISKFHTNWRMQAIRSMEKESFKDDLHYSSAVTLSEADAVRIKAVLVATIDNVKNVIRDSKEEGAHCFAIDFFRI